MTLMALLLAMTAACRTGRPGAAATAEKSATATVKSTAADTLRTHSGSHNTAIKATVSGSSEHTRIHLDRDSAGRLTDIHVSKEATEGKRTRTESAATETARATVSHEAKTLATSEEKTREAKPVGKEGHGAGRTAVAWVAAALFALLGVSLIRRIRK